MIANREQLSYRILQAWARSAIRVVYRHTDVTGISNVPTDRPVILAANHGNALGDIAVLVAKTPRFPQFLAAASWWKRAPARALFGFGGVVPIHRSRDGSGTTENRSTFEACYTALAAGSHIAIFPEGEMHTEPALLPLKTGAARIALGAVDAGVRDVVIVPVGMVYEHRGRFRSDVEIHFGDPIKVDEWTDRARSDPRDAARDLTAALTERLRAVTVNYRSRPEAELLDRVAALVTSDEPAGSGAYACHNELRRALASIPCATTDDSAALDDELTSALETHDLDLAELGISAPGETPMLAEPSERERERLDRELALFGVPAALGLVANAPVVLGAALATKRAPHESWRATAMGVSGTFLCPVVWTTESAYLTRRLGARRALLLTAGGALAGMATIAWRDRLERRCAISRLEHARRDRPESLAAARASRAVIRERVAILTARASERRVGPSA